MFATIISESVIFRNAIEISKDYITGSKTVILPVVLYGFRTWNICNKTTQNVNVSEERAEGNIRAKQQDGEYCTVRGLSNLHRKIFERSNKDEVCETCRMHGIYVRIAHKAPVGKPDGKRPPA